MRNILIIVQARMGSTRLPGKILMDLAGKPLLIRLIEGLSTSTHNVKLIVATSINPENDKLIEVLDEYNIMHYRGSENDVLSRFIDSVKIYEPDIVVRATADDPLMSSECMDILIDNLIENDLDYTFMLGAPLGISVEVINANVFLQLEQENDLTEKDKEHVTTYIKSHPDKFKIKYLNALRKFNYPDLSFTVDTIEEFNYIQDIYNRFGEKTNLQKAIQFTINEKM